MRNGYLDFTRRSGSARCDNAMMNDNKHISVCICTYKRPHLLKRLLEALGDQITGRLFTYSIVIADNDHLQSAKAVVSDFAASSSVSIKYCVEPRQSIALARNKALNSAEGDYIAFIDDDEYPARNWLLILLKTCEEHRVDGVLGPVRRYFDEEPPPWIVRSQLYERQINRTGSIVDWREARTGNVLLKRHILELGVSPFRSEFKAGEDQDFFRRMIEKGYAFIWSDQAMVYEAVPPLRWKRRYMLKRALLRGATARLQPNCGALSIAKSVIAVPVYIAGLPMACIFGHHHFMALLVRLFDHLGKLLALVGINPIKEQYVTD
jgi:glycosyltransferase involved in cell wall biosynthesis